LRRFVKGGNHPDRVIDTLDKQRKGIAEESGNPGHHVEPRPAKFAEGNDLDPLHIAAARLPDRPDPHEVKDLGQIVAAGTHGRAAEQNNADTAGVLTFFCHIAFDKGIAETASHLPCGRSGNALGIDGEEVASGRQNVGLSPGGCSRRAGIDEPA